MFFSIFAIEFISRDKKHSCISAIIQVFLRIEQRLFRNTGWGPPIISWFINHYNPH